MKNDVDANAPTKQPLLYAYRVEPDFNKEVQCVCGGISKETAAEVLNFVHNLPDEAWGKVRDSSHDRTRITYGPHEFHGGQAGGNEIPPALRRMGEEAIEAVRDRAPRAPWDAFSIDTLVLNKYAATQGVGPHKDKGPWKPLVVGVTLSDDPFGKPSVMTFSTFVPTMCGEKTVRLAVPTRHRSVYIFYNRAYTDGEHKRNRCPIAQQGNVYSFTYRSFAQ